MTKAQKTIEVAVPEDDHPQPLLAHLVELRQRLVYSTSGFVVAFIIAYLYSEEVFRFLVQPLAELLSEQAGRRLIYTGVAEAFLTYIKVAAFTAFFFAFPLIAIQIWLFIAPGLYRDEKRIALPLMIATPLLFFAGACFAYYVVFPKAYAFFLSFETPAVPGGLPIQLEAKVNEYLSFVMRIVLAFGICFELPVLLTVMANVGIITAKGLIGKWRIAVVGIATLAAFITPPDVMSMVGLMAPMVALYALSILLVKCVEKRKEKE